MTTSNSARSYSMLRTPVAGDTGTGLDQLIDVINTDNGLAGANVAEDILAGAAAANAMNKIIVEAINATGAGADKVFTAEEVVAINAYIRANHLATWTALHGDDENGAETGFHLVQNDGANGNYRGNNAIDTVADGIYHLGFEIQNGRFLNEDGDANASVSQVAQWLTALYTDHSTSGTGLDRVTDLIMADGGLSRSISESDIEAGADAADALIELILEGLAATGGGVDGRVTADDLVAVNAWIRADSARLAYFTELHGDDEGGEETGFHLVQNDGANTKMFGENFVNTIADGMFHVGFEIEDGRFYNEDGDANATVQDVADWLTYFLSDRSNTGTGLDRITDTIMTDRGLAAGTEADDILGGADAANTINHMLLDSIEATNANDDGWITLEDLYSMNAWVRSDMSRLAAFIEAHGDDENGESTGFHLVQNNGGTTEYFGRNLINTVADGLYHFGFEINQGRFYNEDGDANATLEDVSAWLNYFINNTTLVYGTRGSETLTGTDKSEQFIGDDGNDIINAGGGNDLIYGGQGSDTINGGAGNDIIYGQGGNDTIDGGEGSDTIRVSGVKEDGWYGFGDIDTYRDTGTTGTDTIEAWGTGNVDIALTQFGATSGIEVIDGTHAGGTVTLMGGWIDNVFDFSRVTFVGTNFVIDGKSGNDRITGSAQNDIIIGGLGRDTMNGGGGSDTYLITGNHAGGYASFNEYDTYSDTGTSGTDTIKAIGDGDVDIGVLRFGATSGIEVIDGTGAAGTVRVLGDWNDNVLDFRTVTFVGDNIVLDGEFGNDTITGNAQNNTIVGGAGNDRLDGGNGSDTYIVTGNYAMGRPYFADFDTYTDRGTSGTDTIKAIGDGDVDVGFTRFGATSGIEVIDGTGAAGTVRLFGDWAANVLDFRTTTFIGDNIVIDGNGGNDTIYGNAGNNVIIGGDGNDTIYGGAGSDSFVFNAMPTSYGNIDSIRDFNVADDTIVLDQAIFDTLNLGMLTAGEFVTGTRALDADDHLIYNARTGGLFYDADGAGGLAAVQIARLSANLAMTHEDFQII